MELQIVKWSYNFWPNRLNMLNSFGGQDPKFARANFGIWPPKYFEDLNQKSAILRVSCKNIEKLLRNKKFVGIDYANDIHRECVV